MTISIGLLLALALIFTTVINILEEKKSNLESELTSKEAKMAIESSSCAMYDMRVSVRSLENVVRYSTPLGEEVVKKFLEKTGQTAETRYNNELLDYAKKRDMHVARFNKEAEEANALAPKVKKTLGILYGWILVLHALEIASIAVAIILNAQLFVSALPK